MQRIFALLKLPLFIPPLLALVLVGVWNAAQVKSIAAMENDSVVLRKKISTALATANSRPVSYGMNRPVRSAGGMGKNSIDWLDLSTRMQEMQDGGGLADMRAMMDFQQQLLKMSKDDMIAALDQIASLGLSADARHMLESMLIGPLIGKDPELALKRYGDRLNDGENGMGWQLSTALRDWARKDLASATAWFDRQIADGNFESRTLDGKSEIRGQFEAALLESLMNSDLEAASRRIAALPEEQRREILQQIPFTELGPEEQKAYASLIRQLVPEDERSGSFAHIVSELVDDSGYGKVSTFLDTVRATPEERAASARQTAESYMEVLSNKGSITSDMIEPFRDWLNRQAPGQTDSITGRALAEAAQNGGEFTFSDASQLILHYQQTSGSDDVLVSFLEGFSAHSNLEEAKVLADMITDEKRRQEILNQLK
jgi:hypothetical protein